MSTITEDMPSVVTPIDPADLRLSLQQSERPLLIDVRTPGEFQGRRIPESHNIPLNLLEDDAHQLAAALDGPVVVVCQSGRRAQEAGRLLAEAGASRVQVLDGGVQAWENRALPVHRGRVVWGLERQVRGVAGAIVLTSVLAGLKMPAARWVAAGVGGGLLTAAVTDSCAMGALLTRAPWNRSTELTIAEAVERLRTAHGATGAQ